MEMDVNARKASSAMDTLSPASFAAEVEIASSLNTSPSPVKKQTKKGAPPSSSANPKSSPRKKKDNGHVISIQSGGGGGTRIKASTSVRNSNRNAEATATGEKISTAQPECDPNESGRLIICENSSISPESKNSKDMYKAKEKIGKMRKDEGEIVSEPKVKKRRVRSPIDKNDPELTKAVIDDEIDHVLVEKQLKNNLTAANVKSIIYQVITNNLVKKMMLNKLRHERARDQEKAKLGLGASEEIDDDYLPYEPKLTRSKAKELWTTNTTNEGTSGTDLTNTEYSKSNAAKCLWPISPAKLQLKSLDTLNKTGSQAEESFEIEDDISFNLLMKKDLPPELDDSEDDEYIPSRFDTSNLSDEESNCSTPSVTSETGSPAPGCSSWHTPTSTPKRRTRRTECSDLEDSQSKARNAVVKSSDTLFKTPEPPKDKSKNSQQNDHAIGLRTRSKLPLHDTPIEHFEDQFIPPDITTDMYDWHEGTEADNEDYLAFLKSYWRPSDPLHSSKNAEDDEEEADPEYNVMEDEGEDRHDKEELRDDRAVKIPKKELNELIAELFDNYGDVNMEQTLFGPPRQSNNATAQNQSTTTTTDDKKNSLVPTITSPIVQLPNVNLTADSSTLPGDTTICVQEVAQVVTLTQTQNDILQHQIRQHVQLLAQTFILTDSFNRTCANDAKKLIGDIHRRSQLDNPPATLFSVCNIKPAVQFVNNWGVTRSKSPIKKKILEESCLNSVHPKSGFPVAVVKAVMESEAFCYPELLPHQYINRKTLNAEESPSDAASPQKLANSFRSLRSEDAIWIYELDKIDHRGMKTYQQADYISQNLPLKRTVDQIYHRLRNLHKSKNKMYQDFVKHGILPSPRPEQLQWGPDEPLAPIHKGRHRFPRTWQRMLSLREFSTVVECGTSQTSTNLVPGEMKPFKSSLSPLKRSKPVRPRNSNSKRRSQSQTKVKINIYNKVKDPSLPLSYASPTKQYVSSHSEKSSPSPLAPRNTQMADKNIIRRTLPVKSRPSLFTLPVLPNEDSLPEDYGSQTITIYNENGTPALEYRIPGYVFENQEPTVMKTELADKSLDKEPLPKCEKAEDEGQNKESFEFDEVGQANIVEISPSCAEQRPSITSVSIKDIIRDYKPKYYDDDEDADDDDDEEEIKPKRKGKGKNKKMDSDEIIEVDLISDDDEDKGGRPRSRSSDDESILPSSTSHSPSPSRSESETSNSSGDDEHSSRRPYFKSLAGGEKDSNSKSNTSVNQVGSTNGQTRNMASTSAFRHSNHSIVSNPGPGDGDGDGEDDKEKPNSNKYNKEFSSDADENSQEEVGEDEQEQDQEDLVNCETDDIPDTKASTLRDEKKSPLPRKRKVSKSSPPNLTTTGGSNKSAKRSFKYNTTPMEELLESMDSRTIPNSPSSNRDLKSFEDLQLAFVECFIQRARQRIEVESKNPGLYNTFIQLLSENAVESVDPNSQQKELFLRVENLLADFPDLVTQFTGMIDPDVASEVGRYADHEQERSYFRFLDVFEKWAKSPQLKAKILLKCRSLRDDPNVTKEKVVAVMDQCFDQNVLMIESWQAMFPLFFCPDSHPGDFEEIELEMEDRPVSSVANDTSTEHETTASGSDIDVEYIKLPEETNPVASSTCPCTCHENSSNLQFRNRAKHCNKCRIKFQDGKIYSVEGRTMKPVDVQHTLPSIAKDIVLKKICSTCHKPFSRTPRNRTRSRSPAAAAPKKTTVITCTCTAESSDTDTLYDSVVNPKPSCSTTMSKSSPLTHSREVSAATPSTSFRTQPIPVITEPVRNPTAAKAEWTIEEDRRILTMWQSVGWPGAANKLELPNRSLEQINERFTYLQKFVLEKLNQTSK